MPKPVLRVRRNRRNPRNQNIDTLAMTKDAIEQLNNLMDLIKGSGFQVLTFGNDDCYYDDDDTGRQRLRVSLFVDLSVK